jgi:arsenic resistance protein ArsH
VRGRSDYLVNRYSERKGDALQRALASSAEAVEKV